MLPGTRHGRCWIISSGWWATRNDCQIDLNRTSVKLISIMILVKDLAFITLTLKIRLDLVYQRIRWHFWGTSYKQESYQTISFAIFLFASFNWFLYKIKTKAQSATILLLFNLSFSIITYHNSCLKSTACSIHLATLKRFLSDKSGPINCKLSGNCCDDNLIGIEIAGMPAKRNARINKTKTSGDDTQMSKCSQGFFVWIYMQKEADEICTTGKWVIISHSDRFITGKDHFESLNAGRSCDTLINSVLW